MKKPVLILAITSALALGSTAVAVASTATSTDVQALATAESHVVTLLHQYKDTPAWKAQYKAAVAKQAADLAKLNVALSAKAVVPITTATTTTPPPSDTVPRTTGM